MASETLTQTLARNPILGAALAPGDAFGLLDSSGSGLGKDAAILVSELVKALRTRNAQANSTGNSTVTCGWLALLHTEVLTFTGAGSTTRVVVLAIPAGLSAGARLAVRCVLPATADITVEFRNATAGGDLLTSLLTDTSGDDKVAEFEFDGTQWNFLRFDAYATA